MFTVTLHGIATALLLYAVGFAQELPRPQAPDRDTRPVAGTASISGRVTDRESGQPLADVTLEVSRADGRRPPLPGIARTDRDGRYAFRALPPGEYYVAAHPSHLRPTHLLQYFGETKPSNPGVTRRRAPIRVTDGEARTNVDLALWRALAITGHVVDDLGQPLANVAVFVEEWESSNRLYMGFDRRSDDRGMFRLFGLAPGRYRVCADSTLFDFSDTERARPVRTCHPAAASDADAQPVILSSSDAADVAIRVQFSRVFSVTGTILNSAGVRLDDIHPNLVYVDRNRMMSDELLMNPGGAFTARGLVPGDYAIRVDVGGEKSATVPEREVAYVPFRIESADIEGLTVVTSKPARVRGRVVFEDGAPRETLKPMTVTTVFDPATARMMVGNSPSAIVNPDLTFDLSGMFGPRMLTVAGAPPDHIVRTVRYEGREVTFVPTDFKDSGESRPVEIVLTNRGARIDGRVLDDKGNPAGDAVVVLLPADTARWNHATRYAGQFTVKEDGSFRAGPVLAGDYLILAGRTDTVSMLFNRSDDIPSMVKAITRVAERITLGENEQKGIDLRLSSISY